MSLIFVGCGNRYEPGYYYSSNGTKGIVVEVDDNGFATLLLSLDEAIDLDADSARVWASTLEGEGWELPGKEDLEKVRKYRVVISKTLEKKKLLPLMSGTTLYWSSTDCSESHVNACSAEGMRCFFRTNHSYLYRARAVKKL